MDPISFLAALYAVHLAAAVTPGPNTLLVTTLAAGQSRRIAAWAAAGTASGALIWVALSLGGASALLDAAPGLADWLRWIGAGYLIVLGLQALAAAVAARRAGSEEIPAPPPTAPAAFRLGLLVNISNPKSLAYYLSLLVATAGPDTPVWLRVAGGAGMVAISLAWYLALGWLFSRPALQRRYRRLRPVLNAITGALMLGFAATLLFAA